LTTSPHPRPSINSLPSGKGLKLTLEFSRCEVSRHCQTDARHIIDNSNGFNHLRGSPYALNLAHVGYDGRALDIRGDGYRFPFIQNRVVSVSPLENPKGASQTSR